MCICKSKSGMLLLWLLLFYERWQKGNTWATAAGRQSWASEGRHHKNRCWLLAVACGGACAHDDHQQCHLTLRYAYPATADPYTYICTYLYMYIKLCAVSHKSLADISSKFKMCPLLKNNKIKIILSVWVDFLENQRRQVYTAVPISGVIINL